MAAIGRQYPAVVWIGVAALVVATIVIGGGNFLSARLLHGLLEFRPVRQSPNETNSMS